MKGLKIKKYYMFNFNKIAKDIEVIAIEKDPDKMAHYIYFVIKQHPDSEFIENYYSNLKKTRGFLKKTFEWDFNKIFIFSAKLNSLTRYMKKSD